MANLQESILQEYKFHFPQDTLRDIANRTNIQVTRIFRLFNGSSMKLCEYEVLKNQIPKKDTTQFNKLAYECTQHLSAARLNLLTYQMIHGLKLNQLSKKTKYDEAISNFPQMA